MNPEARPADGEPEKLASAFKLNKFLPPSGLTSICSAHCSWTVVSYYQVSVSTFKYRGCIFIVYTHNNKLLNVL